MSRLAAYFYNQGGDTKKVFSELNGEESKNNVPDGATIRKSVMSDGGDLTCIQDGKIIVDMNPQNLGKDGNLLLTENGQPLLNELIEKMRASAPNEEVVTYANLPTNVPNPADNSKMLNKKYVVVANGRKNLLGDRLNKQHHNKFVCYIAYPVK